MSLFIKFIFRYSRYQKKIMKIWISLFKIKNGLKHRFSSFGYINHDITLNRNPAFSIGRAPRSLDLNINQCSLFSCKVGKLVWLEEKLDLTKNGSSNWYKTDWNCSNLYIKEKHIWRHFEAIIIENCLQILYMKKITLMKFVSIDSR